MTIAVVHGMVVLRRVKFGIFLVEFDSAGTE